MSEIEITERIVCGRVLTRAQQQYIVALMRRVEELVAENERLRATVADLGAVLRERDERESTPPEDD